MYSHSITGLIRAWCAGMSVEFGWMDWHFSLEKVRLSTSIAFEEQSIKADSDGEWEPRERPWVIGEKDRANRKAIDKKWEENPNIRLSSPTRRLDASIMRSSYHLFDPIFIGIPEDKESFPDTTDLKEISSIDLEIHETDRPLSKSRGHLNHFEDNTRTGIDHIEESTCLILVVNSAFFDTIEKALDSGGTFYMGVHLKCWHWMGPEGESTLFINKDGFSMKTGDGLAEISSFMAIKTYTPELDEQDELSEAVDPDEQVDFKTRINRSLVSITKELAAIRASIHKIVVGVFTFVIIYAFLDHFG